jgi:hypothetical protein
LPILSSFLLSVFRDKLGSVSHEYFQEQLVSIHKWWSMSSLYKGFSSATCLSVFFVSFIILLLVAVLLDAAFNVAGVLLG